MTTSSQLQLVDDVTHPASMLSSLATRYNVTSSNRLFDVILPNASAAVSEDIYVPPFTDTAIIVSAVILFTFLVFGLIGNILTIIVITTNNALRNIFTTFIVSLCVSDLWSALISWLCLYRRTWGFDVWSPLPPVFCRFYWASDLTTSYATALHIFSFSILRYMSIQFPIKFSKITLRHAQIWIAFIWILTFCCGFIPFFIFFDARQRDRSDGSPDARWPACTITMEWYEIYLTYQKIAYALFLYAPTIGIVIISCLIGISLCTRVKKMKTKRRKKELQAVIQLVLIVISYLIGYIPFTAYEFWSVQPLPNTTYFRYLDYWFGMVQYYFLRFSECLNPLFYNLGSTKMRKYTIDFVRRKILRRPKEKQQFVSSTESSGRRLSRQMSYPIS